MPHVVVLKAEHEYPAPALLDALREAGVSAAVSAAGGVAPNGNGSQPSVVLCEVADGADVTEIHAAVSLASAAWPHAALVACRRTLPEGDRVAGRRLDAAALKRLGFRAVAEDPAQVPALLRELDEQGGEAGELPPAPENFESLPPASLLLPEDLPVAHLRAAFEAVASLHFVGDQQSAAQTALAGLAPLVSADRWAIYLTDAEPGERAARFEPLAARGLTARERDPRAEDWRRAMHADALMALVGQESEAARAACASAEAVSAREAGRRILAIPLVSGDRVLAVLEALREGACGAAAREFSPADRALLSALAVPLAAALANSARIAEAERLSLTDDLTKLHNARFLRQYLTAEIKRARRYDSQVSALFLDLDDFKEINDRHGHLVGSHVLMEMASVILTGVRDTDAVARYGGDEFVVILPETNTELALKVAERIREKIAAHHFSGGRSLRLRLTASLGIATFPAHAQSPQQLIANADAAMYEAKAARKNCVRFAPEPESGDRG
jgi:diguanylate cyclase (GGDEF)-like protein